MTRWDSNSPCSSCSWTKRSVRSVRSIRQNWQRLRGPLGSWSTRCVACRYGCGPPCWTTWVSCRHWSGISRTTPGKRASRWTSGIADLAYGCIPQIVTAAYRIVQEALTNVIRHARTDHVAVVVEARDGTINVDVRDEGVGFDPSAVSMSTGCKRYEGARRLPWRVLCAGIRAWQRYALDGNNPRSRAGR